MTWPSGSPRVYAVTRSSSPVVGDRPVRIIEFAGGVLVMIGLLAGLVAFIASGQMAFAYFLAHAPRGGWPIQNEGELAALFCFAFLFISARGAGIWSFDAALFRRRRSMPSATAEGWSRA